MSMSVLWKICHTGPSQNHQDAEEHVEYNLTYLKIQIIPNTKETPELLILFPSERDIGKEKVGDFYLFLVFFYMILKTHIYICDFI